MGTFRFALLAVGLSALTFIGISWGNKGFPVLTFGVGPLKPDARIPTFEESVKQGIRRDWENSKTNQSDGNSERDKLRLELLQASTAYELSPCDDTIKSNLVKALTDYTQAWHAMAFCKAGLDGCPAGRDARLDAAAADFKTPADVHMHEALRKAMRQGGITREDFPNSIRNYVFGWGGAPSREPEAACVAARQAMNR